MSWTIERSLPEISTPGGQYQMETDDLEHEIINAAKWAGLYGFQVLIDGVNVEREDIDDFDPYEIQSIVIKPNDVAA